MIDCVEIDAGVAEWQTRRTQNPLSLVDMRVQVPPPVPKGTEVIRFSNYLRPFSNYMLDPDPVQNPSYRVIVMIIAGRLDVIPL